MEKNSDNAWSTGEGKNKPLQYSCLENSVNSMKRQKDRTLKDELPRSVCAHMLLEISGEITPERPKRQTQSNNNTQLWILGTLWRVDVFTEPRQNQHPVVDVTGDGSKFRCSKEHYCIGTWVVRSMNQGKL